MKYDPTELEKISQQSWLSMWRGLPSDAVKDLGMDVSTFGPIQATVVGNLPEARSLNRIQGVGERRTIQDGHLTAAIEWMREMGVEYQVEVPLTYAFPSSLRAIPWLADRELKSDGRVITYVRDTSPPDCPEDPCVEVFGLVGEPNDGPTMCHVVDGVLDLAMPAWVLIYSLPEKERWRCYTALVDGEEEMVSACGAMYVRDGIARLDVEITKASTRGESLNRALLRQRLIDAAEAGCHTVMAQLPASSLAGVEPLRRNLLREGFIEAYRTNCWKRPGYVRSGQDQVSPYWLSN